MDPVTLGRVEAHRYGSGGETFLDCNGAFSRLDLLDSTSASRKEIFMALLPDRQEPATINRLMEEEMATK